MSNKKPFEIEDLDFTVLGKILDESEINVTVQTVTNADRIEEFRGAFGFGREGTFTDNETAAIFNNYLNLEKSCPCDDLPLNYKIFFEEVKEYAFARSHGLRADSFAEGIDVLYTIYGDLIAQGFSAAVINEGFRRVHESNMSKLDEKGKPVYREDGKLMKGPCYKRADLSDLVEE